MNSIALDIISMSVEARRWRQMPGEQDLVHHAGVTRRRPAAGLIADPRSILGASCAAFGQPCSKVRRTGDREELVSVAPGQSTVR
jgi:hypothetical protein